MSGSAERKPSKVLVWFMLVFTAGVVLTLLAALVLMTLQSPRFFNLDLPWIDPALAELKRLVTVLMLGAIVFKGAVHILYRR